MQKVIAGQLHKMAHEAAAPVRYFLSLGDESFPVTPEVGHRVTVRFSGAITCVECGRRIKKTYNDGYCFPCARD